MSDTVSKQNKMFRLRLKRYLDNITKASEEADFFIEPDIETMKRIEDNSDK